MVLPAGTATEKDVQGLRPGTEYIVTLKVFQFYFVKCMNKTVAWTGKAELNTILYYIIYTSSNITQNIGTFVILVMAASSFNLPSGVKLGFLHIETTVSSLFSPLSARHITDRRQSCSVEYFNICKMDGGALSGPLHPDSDLSSHREKPHTQLHQHQRCGARPDALLHLRLLRYHRKPCRPGEDKQSEDHFDLWVTFSPFVDVTHKQQHHIPLVSPAWTNSTKNLATAMFTKCRCIVLSVTLYP